MATFAHTLASTSETSNAATKNMMRQSSEMQSKLEGSRRTFETGAESLVQELKGQASFANDAVREQMKSVADAGDYAKNEQTKARDQISLMARNLKRNSKAMDQAATEMETEMNEDINKALDSTGKGNQVTGAIAAMEKENEHEHEAMNKEVDEATKAMAGVMTKANDVISSSGKALANQQKRLTEVSEDAQSQFGGMTDALDQEDHITRQLLTDLHDNTHDLAAHMKDREQKILKKR